MVMMMVSNFPARAGGTSHFLPRDQISHLQPRIDANHTLRLIISQFSNGKFINLSYNKSTAHYFRYCWKNTSPFWEEAYLLQSYRGWMSTIQMINDHKSTSRWSMMKIMPRVMQASAGRDSDRWLLSSFWWSQLPSPLSSTDHHHSLPFDHLWSFPLKYKI